MDVNNKISDVLITIGKNVRKYRLLKNIKQQDLACNMGNTDKSTISNIERFACNGLNISTVVKICIVLDIEIKDLFEK